MEQPREERRYTYADYCTWDDSENWEIINGEPYMLAAPGERHQSVSMNLTEQLLSLLKEKGKPCKLYAAPFSVRLNADKGDDTVVQPDLVVVCDKSKIDDKGCNGAPDLVIEILSPSTAQRDKWVKFHAYRKAGVREYWIVDPDSKTVQVCTLRGEEYIITAYADVDNAPVTVLPECKVDLKEVFEEL